MQTLDVHKCNEFNSHLPANHMTCDCLPNEHGKRPENYFAQLCISCGGQSLRSWDKVPIKPLTYFHSTGLPCVLLFFFHFLSLTFCNPKTWGNPDNPEFANPKGLPPLPTISDSTPLVHLLVCLSLQSEVTVPNMCLYHRNFVNLNLPQISQLSQPIWTVHKIWIWCFCGDHVTRSRR